MTDLQETQEASQRLTYTPPVQPLPGTLVSAPEVTLDKLMEAAEPLVRTYLESQERMHQRDREYDARLLEYESRRHRNLTWTVGAIVAVVLVFAAYLISRGRDAVALDVIKLVASLGSVGFGGYGIAMARRRRDDEE